MFNPIKLIVLGLLGMGTLALAYPAEAAAAGPADVAAIAGNEPYRAGEPHRGNGNGNDREREDREREHREREQRENRERENREREQRERREREDRERREREERERREHEHRGGNGRDDHRNGRGY